MRVTIEIIPLFVALFLVGCSAPEFRNNPPRNLRICCFGDSLVEGVGASNRDKTSYAAQLGTMLGAEVTNWGTSGDTTGDGVRKLDRFQGQDFGIVVVTLGGNDILRRVHWQETKGNLETIFTRLTDAGHFVVFTGVVGPLNPTRSKHYGKLCEQFGVLYVPDVLDDVTGNPDMLADEIHPNDAGYRLMAERVARAIRDAGLFSAPAP